MSNRYVCKLSDEVLKKAHEELNEPLENEKRLVFIDNLLKLYKEKYPDQKLTSEECSDSFLLMFLRAKKFDVEKAATQMHNFINRKTLFPEAFEVVDHPTLIKNFLDTRFITCLEGVAKNNSAILFLRPCFGVDEPKLENVFGGVFLSLQKILEKEENQIHGVTMLEDMDFVKTGLVKQLGPVIAKKIASMVQDTMPLRLKNICFINESTVLDFVFSLIKPFLNQKTKDRMVLVGKDMKLLHEKIDKKYLPVAYGGLLNEEELNFDQWKQVLLGKSTAM